MGHTTQTDHAVSVLDEKLGKPSEVKLQQEDTTLQAQLHKTLQSFDDLNDSQNYTAAFLKFINLICNIQHRVLETKAVLLHITSTMDKADEISKKLEKDYFQAFFGKLADPKSCKSLYQEFHPNFGLPGWWNTSMIYKTPGLKDRIHKLSPLEITSTLRRCGLTRKEDLDYAVAAADFLKTQMNELEAQHKAMQDITKEYHQVGYTNVKGIFGAVMTTAQNLAYFDANGINAIWSVHVQPAFADVSKIYFIEDDTYWMDPQYKEGAPSVDNNNMPPPPPPEVVTNNSTNTNNNNNSNNSNVRSLASIIGNTAMKKK